MRDWEKIKQKIFPIFKRHILVSHLRLHKAKYNVYLETLILSLISVDWICSFISHSWYTSQDDIHNIIIKLGLKSFIIFLKSNFKIIFEHQKQKNVFKYSRDISIYLYIYINI